MFSAIPVSADTDLSAVSLSVLDKSLVLKSHSSSKDLTSAGNSLFETSCLLL